MKNFEVENKYMVKTTLGTLSAVLRTPILSSRTI